MSFHWPHLLWLLVLPFLFLLLEVMRRTVLRAAAWPKILRAWAGAFSVTLGARHTTPEERPRLWLWLGLALCIVALARPQWGVIEEQVFDQSREVLIAVDLSKSMLAQDVKPARLDRAKLLIQSLLDRLKGERVGLVLFSGSAFLQSPLSADYEILREFLPALKPDYLPEGGSNYTAMLEAAIEAFGTSTADRYLIILSDGESTEEGWKQLGQKLRDKGIRIIGLGIGTVAGSFIPDEAGGFVKDERGAVVLSRLSSATLQELAQVTGGAYTDASAWVDLPALLQRTVEAGRKGEFSEKNTTRKVERFQWFLAPGLLLLFISFWAEFPVRPRERALPLGRTGGQRTENRGQAVAAASFAVLCLLSSVLSPPSSASAQGAEADPSAFAKPLTTTVARLAAKDALDAKDYAELAQTTVTYGQRMQSSKQPPAEGAIRDALLAVDRGEKLDAKAADWPKLRRELEELLKKQEPPPQQDQQDQQQNQDQQKQDQQDQDQQKQDQSQNQQQKQSQQQKSDQQKQDQQQQNQQSAFGDMDEKPEQPKQEQKQRPPSGTQKVGGQQEKKNLEQAEDPGLAMPLQKLDQVRDQDSPAKLYQLLQGPKQEPDKKGKDW